MDALNLKPTHVIFHTNVYHTSDDLQKIVGHFQLCKHLGDWIGFKMYRVVSNCKS